MKIQAVYSERWKSSCQRVAKVLRENGLSPEIQRADNGKDWLVFVPIQEHPKANQIVWGDELEARC